MADSMGVETIRNKRYERQILRYVETELYSYPWIKAEIGVLKLNIIDAVPEKAVARSEGVGDPTLAKTIKLLTSKRLKRLSETYEAVGRVLSVLSPEQLRFVEMKYWQREYTDYGIWQRLNISKRTLYRWRDQILTAIAAEMGLM